MPRASLGLVAALLVSLCTALPVRSQSPSVPVPSALEPATTGGIDVVDRALAKLSIHARLLVIGAHPDDEDTSLLTLVSRGMGGEAAYLALSRGDGGQNLIGPELGEGLGLIRTQELLSARRIDGGRQFFTRAFDFGYTRSLDETLSRWPPEVLLEDVGRVVWRFRPQVVVAMFSPEIGGHGQHLASGWAAQRLFGVGAEPPAVPPPGLPPSVRRRLLDEGWLPWTPQALYRRTFFDPEHATFEFSIDQVDPLSGKSIIQLAMASRSQHRSQDMGMLQPLGEWRAGLERVAGPSPEAPPEQTGLFDGIGTELADIADSLPDRSLREATRAELAEVARSAREARAALAPMRLSDSVDAFVAILRRLHSVERRLSEEGGDEARVVAELVAEKIEIAEAGLMAAASIGLEATIDRETLAPGSVGRVAASVWDAGESGAQILSVELETSPSWRVESSTPAEVGAEVGDRGVRQWDFEVRVEETAEPSMAYFSRLPRQGDLYDWSEADPEVRGLPYQGPELSARFALSIGGERVERVREVVAVSRDQAVGEIRRPVRVVPRVEVSVEPRLLLWDVRDDRPRSVTVDLRSHLDSVATGRLGADGEDGWEASSVDFSIPPGGDVTLELQIHPSAGERLVAGHRTVGLYAELEGGPRESSSVPLLEYPHIRPTPLPVPATLEISVFEIDLPQIGPVGYVRGASDLVPEFLREIGIEVELLDDETLARGDLGRFDVIVIGSRAYETDPVLAEANGRLLDFARAGGTLLVQYQQYQFVSGGFAPFALEIARPHDRITDETAPVRVLVPDHPVFHRPNELSSDDWDGWVQERGLYFAHSWGEELVPLLSIADPGTEAQNGGLLVARLGDGAYVYTGLAFFRQLPAGVAGGYRLLANLLAVR